MSEIKARWWVGAAIYQVYIRSFADSDGDGYGDLRGVTQKLDYLSWLGVDGLWLSPTMPSPDDDWGYDVSDYRHVHPALGTMEDLDLLVAEAGRRDMRVLLDLVPNHTSSAHPWFTAALASRNAGTRGYYVWADPAPGGGPPNNWISHTGAPAWTLDERSGQYYLHNFLPSQPDLNWWHPDVHRAFEEILRFWFDRGIAGFRIDVAHALYKDKRLRDNPPAGEDAPEVLRRYQLAQRYNANRPEVHAVYRRWRRIADSYTPPKLLLGETFVFPVEDMLRYYGNGDELDLALNFPFIFSAFSAPDLAAVAEATMTGLPAGACPVWAASNHDVSRLATRWGGGDTRRVRLAHLILATLPGTLVLYYGDEIGMTDVAVPAAAQRDKMPQAGGGGDSRRDGARTPMQWAPSPGAGFCPPGVTPWLPFGDYGSVSVAGQRDRPGSTLTLVRELLSLRKRELAAGIAPYQTLAVAGTCWVYRSGRVTVATNLSGSPAVAPAPAGEVLVSSGATPGRVPGGLLLGPWEGAVLRSSSASTGPAHPGEIDV